MRTAQELVKIAKEALEYIHTQPNVEEAEVFVASNGMNFGRLNYTSHIPCNGLEEPKDEKVEGIHIEVVFRCENGKKEVGSGSEAGTLSKDTVKKALAKAEISRTYDSEFISLPRPSVEKRSLFNYHDPELMDLSPEGFVDAAWRIIGGALECARSSEKLIELVGGEENIADAHLIVGGDLTVLQERIAICSTAMPEVQTDESTLAMAFITAMVENVKMDGDATEAKGGGYGSWTKLAEIDGTPGAKAMENAIASIGGKRVPDGQFDVIFAPAAVASLMDTLLGSFSASSLYSRDSLFAERLGEQVAACHIQLYDLANEPGLVGSKGITCEGMPTGRTDLIRDGKFVGTLCNWYDAQRILSDPEAQEKIGKDPQEWSHAFVPRNGFRFSGPGRIPGGVGAFATNVFLGSSKSVPLNEMITQVKDGLLLGRLWYVYPMGSAKQGDFTGIAVADSYLIKDGKIVHGLAPNSVRIQDNYRRILMGIETVSQEREAPLVWAADSIRHMPYILVRNVGISAVSGSVRVTE